MKGLKGVFGEILRYAQNDTVEMFFNNSDILKLKGDAVFRVSQTFYIIDKIL